MRVLSIVGGRPQFVKLAVMCRAISERKNWVHIIVHTGQHYAPELSDLFFQELEIPRPNHDLGVGSGPHGQQTGEMLKRLEPVLAAEQPDWVLLHGDTNSTLAGAVASSKLPLADLWRPDEFALATVHRAENTDDDGRLRSIVTVLEEIARTICPVVWPVHPRTKARLESLGLSVGSVAMNQPGSYLDMLLLEGRARFILTDSVGVQKEAHFFKVPCITLRDETEWEETLANGCNMLTGACETRIRAAVHDTGKAGPWTAAYGTGQAGAAILNAIDEASARSAAG
jgi:UDP-N-acetylglucosamine 2-epimerase